MGGAEDGISLGTKVIIVMAVISIMIGIFMFGLNVAKKQTKTVSDVTVAAKVGNYDIYNSTDISGSQVWDMLKEKAGCRVNGQDFIVVIHTNTANFTWQSSQSIGDVVSDNPNDDSTVIGEMDSVPPYYISEDWTFHSELLRANGSSGDIYGIELRLMPDEN